MNPIIPGVYTFTGLIVGRVYLIEDGDGLTIIDASLANAAAKILNQLAQKGYAPQDVKRILITHAHPDHVGGLPALQKATGAAVMALAQEKPYIEGTQPIVKPKPADIRGLPKIMAAAPTTTNEPVPVARALEDGETIAEVMGGLQVLWTPGHSPGHATYWQAEKGVMFCGDVMMRMTGRLTLPFAGFTPDMAENKRSLRRLVELNPQVVCLGHGQPLMNDAAATIRRFAQKVEAM